MDFFCYHGLDIYGNRNKQRGREGKNEPKDLSAIDSRGLEVGREGDRIQRQDHIQIHGWGCRTLSGV